MEALEHNNRYKLGHNLEEDVYFLNGERVAVICEGGIEVYRANGVSKKLVEDNIKSYYDALLPTQDHKDKEAQRVWDKRIQEKSRRENQQRTNGLNI